MEVTGEDGTKGSGNYTESNWQNTYHNFCQSLEGDLESTTVKCRNFAQIVLVLTLKPSASLVG
jgi:hypothetical protein